MSFGFSKNKTAEAVLANFPQMCVYSDVPMSEYTTLHLGGNADVVAEVDSHEETKALTAFCRKNAIPCCVIGKGSNLLVKDGGIRGVVIVMGKKMSRIDVAGCSIRASAGASLAQIAQAAAYAGLTGCEFMGGIPGTLGGGITMNAGAYGGEISNIVESVSGITCSGKNFDLKKDELDFSYRHSIFSEKPMIITSATLHLSIGNSAEIAAKMNDFNARRREKQPLDKWSCGSTFKRPASGFAAAMIDECDLKGTRIGGASVSEKHAGFLINEGTSSADYLALMTLVQSRVYEKFGVTLESEVKIIGEDA